MKKLICLVAFLASISCFAQKEKWSVSVSGGMSVGGPAATIKNQMGKQGFDDKGSFNILIWTSTTQYPERSPEGSLLLRFSKKINNFKSLYFIVGQADKSEVTGFKDEGYVNLILIGSSVGPMPKVRYTIFQVGGGYLYQTSSRAKLGIVPSAFIVPYSANDSAKHTSIVPGVSFTARIPLGKEKKQLGFDLVFDANLAPPINMKINEKTTEGFHMNKANMMQISAGIALTFRKIK